MPTPKKYDQGTCDHAVRMYQDRRREYSGESAVVSRRRVGELLDVSPSTLRRCVERTEIVAEALDGRPRKTLGWKTPGRGP